MKRIKDPLYGYIEIEDEFIEIINSVYFQRLRGIIQTSYVSVYPSALHNRFTHSLGVYQLGKIAFDSLINNSKKIISLPRQTIQKYRRIFLFACLCHDLGHSPFSHTGEIFYDKATISEQLLNRVNNDEYKKDLEREEGKNGKIFGQYHEIMSALLTLEVLNDFINEEDFEFFSRCIIGLQYNKASNDNEKLLKSACVELLNSKIIDVDKLDYLIRDSYMSGYNSITIDYIRLLSGIAINEGDLPICYKKSSLSVIETVLTAHDMERRWIQAHPVILYESFLLRVIIKEVEKKFNLNQSSQSLFSLDALTEKGVKISTGKINLLSDSDILYLAKSCYDDKDSFAIKEYFNRNLRHHPIWKTEAEYQKLFAKRIGNDFFEILLDLEEKLNSGIYGVYSLNDSFIDQLSHELEKTQSIYKTTSNKSEQRTLNTKIIKLTTEKKLLNSIKNYFVKRKFLFDLVLITQKQFKSNIYKREFKELPIMFDNHKKTSIVPLKNLTDVPLDISEKDNNFFYLYYKSEARKKIDVENFAVELLKMSM